MFSGIPGRYFNVLLFLPTCIWFHICQAASTVVAGLIWHILSEANWSMYGALWTHDLITLIKISRLHASTVIRLLCMSSPFLTRSFSNKKFVYHHLISFLSGVKYSSFFDRHVIQSPWEDLSSESMKQCVICHKPLDMTNSDTIKLLVFG